MAGLGTCLWQAFPEFNNMKIRKALWQSGSIATNPDDRIGYGIPDMKKAFESLLIDYSSADGSVSDCKTILNWTSKDISAMKYEVERKVFGESNYSKIADVPAVSNINVLENNSYQFADTLINVQAGTVSYRIRQIIDSSASSFTAVYIDTVNIDLATSCVTTGVDPVNPNSKNIVIIPNPAHDQFTLRVITNNPIPNLIIRIVDMRGSSVLQFVRSKGSGTQNFDFLVRRLAKGKYTVAVYDGDHFLISRELIKL
jgi:hypothetical protein